MREAHRVGRCAIVLAAVGLAIHTSEAAVVYDALRVGVDGYAGLSTYHETTGSYIGGSTYLGTDYDIQVADDFVLAAPHEITSVTMDFASLLGVLPGEFGAMPSQMLVEFFSHNPGNISLPQGYPNEAPAAAVTTTAMSFELITTPLLVSPSGFRVTVDLSAAGVSLAAGHWWISVVSYSTPDDFHMPLRLTDMTTGVQTFNRGGGVAHGNGLPSSANVIWHPYDDGIGDLALRIEGNLVPAPAAWGLMIVGAPLLARRRR